jgi:hypothetical protein
MNFNFITLLIIVGFPSINLLGQSNKSINPIVADTTKQKQRKNTTITVKIKIITKQ